ncbi:MAG: phosphonate ABC transporter ATP-binding protein [Euryarchaeota archaeon]|nr:phosphonate ABC transporter ATP-binding protein [Euryarchaeota archaeon]|tara:strand:+ start:16423 stop:17109 length:687 start_codon:yes stop_codon:yes gene_type:complete
MSSVVSAVDLKVGYSSSLVLANIDNLQIDKGEIISIIGESGIGKTTLLRNIAKLQKPLDGELLIFGSSSYPARGNIGYIPQKLGLVKHETVYFNVLEGAVCHESIFKSIFGFHDQKVVDKVEESISLMNLLDKIDAPIKHLSGGQQRRVAIARTMAQGAKLILADEFLSELDDKTANNVWNVMYDYVKANQITLIIVEHNIERAKLADRCFKLEKGDKNYSILVEVEK